jgi:hypothetical protein
MKVQWQVTDTPDGHAHRAAQLGFMETALQGEPIASSLVTPARARGRFLLAFATLSPSKSHLGASAILRDKVDAGAF